MATKKHTPTIYVVSDGRGDTCTQLVDAALIQFEKPHARIVRQSNVRTARRVETIVRKAAEARAIIFYTLVGQDTRSAMTSASRDLLVPTVDVMGPAFSALHDLFQQDPRAKPGLLYTSDKEDPRAKPGLLYTSDKERFDRIEAIDYTLKHDDGQRPHELGRADVVIVGVSRASKSSTCFYLAYEGIRAANVPLHHGIAPPDELLNLDPEKVIGLRVNVMRLMTVREARALNMGLKPGDQYLDKREIAREVNEANRIMDRQNWRCIDVSYQAVEEIAKEVRNLREL